METDRQRLVRRASELNTVSFSVIELQERIREVCSEYLIEAQVDVDRLLRHEDWRVRSSASDIVWWGAGRTDGIDQSIEILLHDPDEDVRAEAALGPYEAARNSPKEAHVKQIFKTILNDAGTPEYVRNAAQTYFSRLDQPSNRDVQSE